jgi:hypothetical protein
LDSAIAFLAGQGNEVVIQGKQQLLMPAQQLNQVACLPLALYAKAILSTIDGGYYFCRHGQKNTDDYFGSGMFADE